MKLFYIRAVSFSILSMLVSACGGSGGGSTTEPPAVVPDTVPPNIVFTPNNITLDSNSSTTVELTFSDNIGISQDPIITCSTGGNFDHVASLFIADLTHEEITATCTAIATDNAGNASEAMLTVLINPASIDNEVPIISFTPKTLIMSSGASENSLLAFSDNMDNDLIPVISCDQGATFQNNQLTVPETAISTDILCTATVTDSANNTASATLNAEVIGSALIALGIDPYQLPNYAAQEVPDYITHDNITDNTITDIGATLGRILYYDTKLSSDDTISCASCHKQEVAFSDTSALSQGVNGVTQRHSMRLINTRFSEETNFRWDENASSLEQQSTLPIKDFNEMGFSGENGAPSIDDLIIKLRDVDYYQDLFNRTFGDSDITESRMQLALTQFVKSIQSFDSKYDQGRAQVSSNEEDFPNFTPSENAGKRLFTDDFEFETALRPGDTQDFQVSKRISGGLNCATCHRPPEFDIDPSSLNNGFIRKAVPEGEDPRQAGEEELHITRSATLRDLMNSEGELNGGMFHTGLSNTLVGISAHYDFRRFVPENNNLDPRLLPNNLPQWLDITQEEQRQLFDFLKTLSGNNVYSDEKWSDPFN